MIADAIRDSLRRRSAGTFDLYERRQGRYQLILPIHHEDGDMVEIYLLDSPHGGNRIRICDFGMALMRLSYVFDVSSPPRQRILESILINNAVSNENGNLYMDVSVDLLYENILQFAGCVQKVCTMRYWSREVPRSAFYDDLKEYISEGLSRFSPVPDCVPINDYPISVDWSLTHRHRDFYLFGVPNNDKAKTAAIALLEFQKAHLKFISLVVHADISALGRRELLYLTRNADVQYPVLEDFRQRGAADMERLVGAA